MAIESKMRRPTAFGHSTDSGTPPGRVSWLAVALAAVVVAASVFAWWWFQIRVVTPAESVGLESNAVAETSDGAYQAVFLDNGQVYFGRLRRKGDAYRLTSVYYMQMRGNPQSGSDDPQSAESVLVKLGSEVHGPADFMDINPDHILFTEDLTADSKVSKAIAEYVSKQRSNP